MRQESDSLGTLLIEDGYYYGVQTARAISNFMISDDTFCNHKNIIDAVVEIKKACARTNCHIGALSREFADAIIYACDEILSGKYYAHFPVNTIRGCGTSINMNANEVISHIANESLYGTKSGPIHPNTHVNMCQSSNDVFPTAMSIVLHREANRLADRMKGVQSAFTKKKKEIGNTVRIGRTCMQDAVPLLVGQHFSGCIQFLKRCRSFLQHHNRAPIHGILGATAVGTGIGLQPLFKKYIYDELSQVTNIAIHEEKNLFDGMQNSDELMTASSALRNIATAYAKIAHDFLLLSSGPAFGIQNLFFPSDNDRYTHICEHICQLTQLVLARDMAISMANQFTEPDIAPSAGVKFISLVESFDILHTASFLLRDVIEKVAVNRALCEEQARASMSLATMVSTIQGYPEGVALVKEADRSGCDCYHAAINTHIYTPEEAHEIFNIKSLTSSSKMEKIVSKFSR